MKKELTIAVILISSAILIFSAGMFFGYTEGLLKGIQRGALKAQAEFQEKIDKYFGKVEEPKQIFSYIGKISKMGSNWFEIEIVLPAHNPFEEEKIFSKKVIVDNKTAVFQRLPKPATQYQQESELAKKNNLPVPNNFITQTKTFADLKIGLTVTAGSSEDIKSKDEFIADSVQIQ